MIGSLGWQGAVGLAIRAERVDPDAEIALRTELGIEHAGLVLELAYAKVDGFGSNEKLAVGDLTDPASLERAVPEGVDTVFHVAADLSFTVAGEEQQYRSNVLGTRNLLEVARRRGAHIDAMLFRRDPRDMIPLVGEVKELGILRANAIRVADEVRDAAGDHVRRSPTHRPPRSLGVPSRP